MAKATTPKNVAVSLRKDGMFVVKPEGTRCATKVLDTTDEALAFAQELADKGGASVLDQA